MQSRHTTLSLAVDELDDAGCPLRRREIAARVVARNGRLAPAERPLKGRTPEETVTSALDVENKRGGVVERVAPGMYGLRKWPDELKYGRDVAGAAVSVRDLRQNLSEHLHRVERGETLRVLNHGRPVAVLGPLPGQGTLIDRLVAERGATRPSGDLLDVEPLPAAPGERPLSEIIEEQREDRV